LCQVEEVGAAAELDLINVASAKEIPPVQGGFRIIRRHNFPLWL
jgi:hypothetical protein